MSALDDPRNYDLDLDTNDLSRLSQQGGEEGMMDTESQLGREKSSLQAAGTFYVEAILDKKIEDGETHYKVKWQGYSVNDSTWEPVENLANVPEYIAKYERNLKRTKKAYMLDEENKHQEAASDSSDSDGHIIKHKGDSLKKKQKVDKYTARIREQDQTPKQKTRTSHQQPGHLKRKDVPREILSIRRTTDPDTILFRVSWEKRADSVTPVDSYMSNKDFLKYNPRFLLAFYQSKVKLQVDSDLDAQSPALPQQSQSMQVTDISLKQNLRPEQTNNTEEAEIQHQQQHNEGEKPASPLMQSTTVQTEEAVAETKEVSCQVSPVYSRLSSPKSEGRGTHHLRGGISAEFKRKLEQELNSANKQSE